MKKIALLLFLLFNVFSYGQSLNNYKYLVMSKRYSFQSVINEYRLNSNARFILAEQGFQVLFDDDILPEELAKDRCKAMYLDIKDPDAFMVTKLQVVFKDCKNNVLFTAQEGVSKEKQKSVAYNEALAMSLNSVKALKYKYDEGNVSTAVIPAVALDITDTKIEDKDYVPNEETAIKVAEAIWYPIYGSKIENYKPYKARMEDGLVWIVEGTLHSKKGGVPYIEINKKDCKILKVTHGK